MGEKQQHLVRAKEAEEIAERFAPGSFENESWLKIAQGYRSLAQGQCDVVSIGENGQQRPHNQNSRKQAQVTRG